ncbi:AbrB/MazE/SpoVT family DNA-binding domain-containing protein [Leisingera sp. F5]|uniref:AbrB/MazE/SpoVT family DNA-binding domain-containing protein n=1 Tax=Leisingera sp. F5 TaxID=1813816 RepID=UPI000A7F6008|nr:AbrB/MazE/SpoVT family DNA-binding domain-containing protein [Leisingera sp. F5]
MTKELFAQVVEVGGRKAALLPQEFSLPEQGSRVRIEGKAIILEAPEDDWQWLADLHSLGPLDPDAAQEAEDDTP